MQRNKSLPSGLDASRVTPDCACHSLRVLGSYLNSLQPNRTLGHRCYQSYPECAGKARMYSTHTQTYCHRVRDKNADLHTHTPSQVHAHQWCFAPIACTYTETYCHRQTKMYTHTHCALHQLHAHTHRHNVTDRQKCRHTHCALHQLHAHRHRQTKMQTHPPSQTERHTHR